MPHFATIHNVLRRPSAQSGMTLTMAVVFLAVVLILVTALYQRTNSNIQSTSRRVNDQDAARVAESGIEKAVWCLNNPGNTADCPGNPNFTGETNIGFGNGSFSTQVSVSGSTATIVSTGTVAGVGGTSTKQLRVTLTTTTANVSFQYGMQSGVGGLLMKNNNKVTGNVFSNGPVLGTKSLITGDVVLAVGQPTADITVDPSVSPLTLASLGTSSSTLYLAQSFIPTVNDKLHSLDLKIAKHGTVPSLSFEIRSDSGNQPGATLYSQAITNGTADNAGWENGWTKEILNTSTAPQLSINTTYWLVLRAGSGGNSNNYWKVVRDTDDSASPTASAKTSPDGTTWAAAGYDLAMITYMGGIPSTLSINCTGSLCPDDNGIGGNAYADTIDSTNIKQHACYQSIDDTVKAGNASETCTGTGSAPVPCTNDNTVYGTGPYCHAGNPSLTPAAFPLSSSQIAVMETQASVDTITGNQLLTDGQSLGPKKIIGDLTINAAASDPAKLTGTVWVKGNIYLNGSLKLNNAYGANSGTILADNPDNPSGSGRIIVGSSGQLLGNSTANTYIMGLSMSTSLSETSAAINVSNNLTAGVVYAANGAVNIQNNADIKEVTGQKIIMQNNTSITYQTGLASVIFTSGPGASWIYQPGSYQIVR